MESDIRELQDNYKRYNIHIMGIAEEENEKITEEIFEEIMTKKSSNIKSRHQTTYAGN